MGRKCTRKKGRRKDTEPMKDERIGVRDEKTKEISFLELKRHAQ
jgi:hypothetical protein